MRTASCAGSIFSRWPARVCLGLTVLGLAWSSFLAPIVQARDYPLEIIELRSRLPEELIPIVAPLAGADGTVVGAQHALFVRASPERLADIRRALEELDRPARSLLIQVRQGSSLDASGVGVGARVDESWGGGETSGRIRPGPPGPRGTQVNASAGRTGEERHLIQEVRALDGYPAFIAVGQEQPLSYRELAIGPHGALVRQGQEYRRAERGFSVLPRVQGDRVLLEIETRSESPGRGGAVDTGTLISRIEGRLGDWIPIGASSDSRQSRSGGLLYGTQGRRETLNQVELRVLALD